MSARPRKILDTLFVMAQDIVPVSRARIVAALVYKNKIVAFGHNQSKTHPMASRFSKHEEAISLHAEVACIRNAINKYGIEFVAKCDIYVARAKMTGDGQFVVGMAKPCKGCDEAISFFGIRKAFYTIDDGHYGIGHYRK